MKVLTPDEKYAHYKKIKEIRQRAERARQRYCDGDITIKKMKCISKEVKEEEIKYVKDSGVIMYFGKLFKASV